jgi:predicted amidohydrolase YtcJ
VILNVTPHWVGGEMGTAAADTLGWDRFNRVYQFNPVIDAGSVIDFSSDVVSAYEADRADPFLGMQIAHTRTDARYPMQPGPGTVPDTTIRQPASARIALSVLLDGYTRYGAVQLRLAHRIGSIEAGKLANMSILNADPFRVPEDEIHDIEPLAVLFEGQVVSGELPGQPIPTTTPGADRRT